MDARVGLEERAEAHRAARRRASRRASRPVAETMPTDAVTSSPNGLPRTTSHSPTCEVVGVAERQRRGGAARRSRAARGRARTSRPTSLRGDLGAVGEHDAQLGRRGGDVIVREDVDAVRLDRGSRCRARRRPSVSGAPGNIAAGPDLTGVRGADRDDAVARARDEVDERARRARVEDARLRRVAGRGGGRSAGARCARGRRRRAIAASAATRGERGERGEAGARAARPGASPARPSARRRTRRAGRRSGSRAASARPRRGCPSSSARASRARRSGGARSRDRAGCGCPSGAGILPSAISAVDASDRTCVEKSTGPSATGAGPPCARRYTARRGRARGRASACAATP